MDILREKIGIFMVLLSVLALLSAATYFQGQDIVPKYTETPETLRLQGSALQIIGKGCTTAYYIDEDCDGYGVGVRSDGDYGIPIYPQNCNDINEVKKPRIGDMPDADDSDPEVNTWATVETKYDAGIAGVKGVLENRYPHLKNIAYNIYFIDPSTDEPIGQPNNINVPYKSLGTLPKINPGDVIVYKKGIYYNDLGWTAEKFNGEEGKPILLISFPGENVVFDTKKTVMSAGYKNHYVILDGFKGTCDIACPVYCNNGKWEYGTGYVGIMLDAYEENTIHTNLEIANMKWGSWGSSAEKKYITIQNSIIHDTREEHGIYITNHKDLYGVAPEITGVNIINNILYRNNRHGFQINGEVSNFVVEDNKIHSNAYGAISLINGVQNSVFENNLFFNNNRGIVLFSYQDYYYWYCDKDPKITEKTEDSIAKCNTINGIMVPYESAESNDNNLFINNIIWLGEFFNFIGDSGPPSDQPAITFNDANSYFPKEFKNNVFRNNIFVTSKTPTILAHQLKHLSTTVFENNMFFRTDLGSEYLYSVDSSNNPTRTSTCSYPGTTCYFWNFNTFQSNFNTNNIKNNIEFRGSIGDLFKDVNINYFNQQQLFNFDHVKGSHAIDSGIETNAPITDMRGVSRDSKPDLGCYEYRESFGILENTHLPVAAIGFYYYKKLTGYGGTPPYTFSLVPSMGAFPPGLTLSSSGVISGTPTHATNYLFFVDIKDSSNPVNEKKENMFIISVINSQCDPATAPPKECDLEKGVCSGSRSSCVDYKWTTCDYGANYETVETKCDGLDNDCDGPVDEGLENSCPLQQGVCSGSKSVCTSGAYTSCNYGSSYQQSETSCNDGLDNDCDALVDCYDNSCFQNAACINTLTGLNAKYYNGNDAEFREGKYFLNLAVQRTDPHLTFNWPSSPGTGINQNYFAAKWDGFIRIDTPGEYTFYASADDYIKLYIGDKTLASGPTEKSVKHTFESGGYYPIKAEYIQWYGGAWVSVSYEGPGLSRRAIPPFVLYTSEPSKQPPSISNPTPSGKISISQNTLQIQVSTDIESTCKYSSTPGMDYTQMTSTFQNTGGKTHSQQIAVESERKYTYYIKCSSAGVSNPQDSLLSFETNRASITHGGYYDGATTNFNDPAINTRSISTLTLEKTQSGAIVFTVPISIKRDMDLKAFTEITKRSIYVDSAKLPELNFPALIGFYNTGLKNPEIWMDKIKCPPNQCAFIGFYRDVNNAYVYQVSHFTNYTLRENCIDNDGDRYNSTGGECGPADCNDNNKDIYPGRTELCDGIDNNCDMVIDEGCSCTPPGLNRTCGPLNDTGICAFGNQTCEGDQWSTQCVGAVYSAPEICGNGLDDDCDGETDEDCGPCRDKDGDKFNVSLDPSKDCGPIDCNDNNPAIYPGAPEVCGNGVDENCDGKDLSCNIEGGNGGGNGGGGIDNQKSCTEGNKKHAHGSRTVCGTDIGVCKTGIKECDDGKWSECEGQVGPSEEECDGLDNDCDGEVDETCICVHGTEKPCGSNIGICRQGIQKCVKGSWSSCEGNIPPASEDICFNEKDDNCNGETDEKCEKAFETCNNGEIDSGERGIDCGGKCPKKCPEIELIFVLMIMVGLFGMIGTTIYLGYLK